MRKIKNLRTLSYCFASALLATAPDASFAPIAKPAHEALLSRDRALKELPDGIKKFTSVKSGIEFQIARDFFEIKSVCRATQKINIQRSFALSKWLNENISQDEWEKSPFFFRRAAYRITATQDFSNAKIELLGKIQKTIPDHPEFVKWVQEAKTLSYRRIYEDEFLSREITDWDNVMRDTERLTIFMERATITALNIFLVDTDLPKILVIKDAPLPEDGRRRYGRYEMRHDTLKYNMGPNGIFTAESAIDNIIHESFHATQWRLAKGYKNGHLQSYMNDAGEKYFYIMIEGLGANPDASSNYDFYRNTFTERASFFVSNAKNETEKSPEWFKANASASKDYQNPYLGEVPKACFK